MPARSSDIDAGALDAALAMGSGLDVLTDSSALDRVLSPGTSRRKGKRKSSGSFAEDSVKELSELEAGLKERKAAEAARFKRATDSEFWFAVCFETREEKDDFLRWTGLIELGDKYIDGRVVAEVFKKIISGEFVVPDDVT